MHLFDLTLPLASIFSKSKINIWQQRDNYACLYKRLLGDSSLLIIATDLFRISFISKRRHRILKRMVAFGSYYQKEY